jgi:Protein of unknown function (DUF3011)
MPAQLARGASITCSSNDMRRGYCPVDTRGGVQLIYQRGSSPCIFGQTCGHDQRGIWVDRSCRADFAVGYTGGPVGPPWPGWGNSYTVYCSSDGGRRSICPVDTRGGSIDPVNAVAHPAFTVRVGAITAMESGWTEDAAPTLRLVRRAGDRPPNRSFFAVPTMVGGKFAQSTLVGAHESSASAPMRIVFMAAVGAMMLGSGNLGGPRMPRGFRGRHPAVGSFCILRKWWTEQRKQERRVCLDD